MSESWKWMLEHVFNELEGRDFLVAIIAIGVFILIFCNKIPEAYVATIISGLLGYAVGRPNS